MDPETSEGKRPIPRFTSFKPGLVTSNGHQDHEATTSPVNLERKARHRSGHRGHRHRSHFREQSREHRTHRSLTKDEYVHTRQPEDLPPRLKTTPKSEEGIGDLYVVDRKGDNYNVTYGTIHRYNIPLYHRIGSGCVLGLPSRYKIDRDSTLDAALVIRADAWYNDGARTKNKSMLSKINLRETKLLRVRREIDSTMNDARRDFIPLSTNGSRKRRRVLPVVSPLSESDSEADRYAYRSVEGKAKPSQDLSSDLEATTATDLSDDQGIMDLEAGVKERNIELSRHVEDNPLDVNAWIRLIDHQHTLIRGSKADSRPLTSAEKRSLSDIKLSLYEKALKRVGSHSSKDRLLLGLLEEGAIVWDTKLLSEKWHAVLRSNPGYINLWIKYLDFHQTEFFGFSFERCRATFLECMKLNASSSPSREQATIQIYLFLRMTTFIREAGYVELAVGLWQAVLEFTFFRPEELGANEATSLFREFWESEVPRIGEIGAKGWRDGNCAALESKADAPETYIEPESLFMSWLKFERAHECRARLPAHALDEVDDDDPYRVILFSDIQEFIPFFWDLQSPDILIQGFLRFCLLPLLQFPMASDSIRSWDGDSFLRNEFMGLPDVALAEWLNNSHPPSRVSAPLLDAFPLNNFIHTLDSSFPDQASWFPSLSLWKEIVFGSSSTIDPYWVRNALRLLVGAFPLLDGLAEYVIAIEHACNPKEAKKYAKSLLKKRPSDLRLYNVYALMECRSGDRVAADHVWTTTLSMYGSLSSSNKLEYSVIWRTWLWESLNIRDMKKAVHLLVAVPQYNVDTRFFTETPDSRTMSPAEFLKTKSLLSSNQEQALAVLNIRAFVASTECLALLFYLTCSSDLDSAMDVYRTALDWLNKVPHTITEILLSFTRELLHQTRARLLYYHATNSKIYKPPQIQKLLAESISLFPHNTIFLSLFSWNESRFHIDERVRDVLRDLVTKGKPNSCDPDHSVPITTHLFTIHTELHRPVISGSTLHSVRAAFERAIGDNPIATSKDRNRFSLSLWKLYVLFELSRDNVQQAKEVFYRGMRTCPWSKEHIMLAFSHLHADTVQRRPQVQGSTGGMEFEELRHVYHVLVDKGLRIHVDIQSELEEVEMPVEQRAKGTQNREISKENCGDVVLPDDRETEIEEDD